MTDNTDILSIWHIFVKPLELLYRPLRGCESQIEPPLPFKSTNKNQNEPAQPWPCLTCPSLDVCD